MNARSALVLVCLLGAALRFATLDVQSLWYDEAVTAQLLVKDLAGMLDAIPDSESSPPLYYVLAWLWARALGTGEAALRALPALLGTATIPVVWALGRRLAGERAGLVAAALVAVNPMLVWLSQEARAYALLVLLAAIATVLWLRAIERPHAGRALAWSAVAALAVATHYYAIFLVAAQAAWLVVRARDGRVRAAALGPLAVALAALAPLALAQRANDSAAFIGDTSLATRILQVPKQLLVGYDAPAETLLAGLSAIVVVVAAIGMRRLGDRPEVARTGALLVAALALALVLAFAGEDHLITRNLVWVVPAGAALAAAGLVEVLRRRPGLGRAAIAGACVLGVAAVAGVALDPRSQRDDWRGAVAALGTAPGERMIVATPASAFAPLRYYLPSARRLDAPIVTAEIDFVALSANRTPGRRPDPPRPRTPPSIPPFGVIVSERAETFTVLRQRAAEAQLPAPGAVAAGLDGSPPALVAFTR